MKPIISRRPAIALTVAGVIIIAIIYSLFDPAAPFFPRCPIKMMTGVDCPGCGSQRALHALLDGRFAEAFAFNPLLFLLGPYACTVIILEWFPQRHPRLRTALTSTTAIAAIMVAIVAWTIIRNI